MSGGRPISFPSLFPRPLTSPRSNPALSFSLPRRSVAGLLKCDDATKSFQLTLKSAAPGHAAAMLAEVTEAVATAAALAAKEAAKAAKGGDDD